MQQSPVFSGRGPIYFRNPARIDFIMSIRLFPNRLVPCNTYNYSIINDWARKEALDGVALVIICSPSPSNFFSYAAVIVP